MTIQRTKTKLALDGRWNLEELSETTRGYIQLYGFAYSLLADLPTTRRNEIDYIYGKFPWRGGYSTVNFFTQLFHNIPPKLRPEIERIKYGSPGFIELSEILLVAGTIAGIVKFVCSAINNANDTYRKIQKGSIEHKLARINFREKDRQLTQEEIIFSESSAKSLIKVLGLTEAQEELIDQRVQGNSVMKLKILLSVFRRVQPLAEKQSEGKLKITGKETDEA
jgi:hypothetical protein